MAPFTPDQLAAGWRESGERWEQSARRTLAHDRATLVIGGYGAGLRVDKGALIVKDGRTHDPQAPAIHTLHRGVHAIGSIVILADSGALSIDALHWCQDQAITVMMLDTNGRHLSTLTPDTRGDIALRRAQYGLDDAGRASLARWLIVRKIAGQRATLQAHSALPRADQAITHLGHCLKWFELPTLPPWLHDMDTLRTFEGRAATTYFAAWLGHPLRWRKSDAKRVPPHWQRIRERTSPIGPNGRHAVDPCNAILNYSYAVLDGQCRRALAREGFDPACGILHADKAGRDSLVYDLMELYRPAVDDRVLTFLDKTTFTYGDLVMASNGQCRLHPQMARAVVAACRVPSAEVDAAARDLRTRLIA